MSGMAKNVLYFDSYTIILLAAQWLDLPIGNVICSLELPESQYINKNLPEFHLEELETLVVALISTESETQRPMDEFVVF